MKIVKISEKIGLALLLAFCLSCCDHDAIYNEEQYKTVVYLLSGSDNIFTEAYTLSENEPVRFLSVGVGGSQSNQKNIVVTLEKDNLAMFNKYNSDNFDIDTEKYARLLPAHRFEIMSYIVNIPAQSTEQYARVPIKVNPHGLSPDSTYFIPIAIRSVSNYEVNEDKKNVLFRVTIENEYARHRIVTQYTKKGDVKDQLTPQYATTLSGTKWVQPLTQNRVRMFVGNFNQTTSSPLVDIERYAMVVKVNEDNSLEIFPWGTIDVEMLEMEDYNLYNPKVMQGTKEQRVFFLYYRYRIMNPNGTYGNWFEVRETLTRVEEN